MWIQQTKIRLKYEMYKGLYNAMKYLKELWINTYMFYERFQMIILGIFVFGIIEFLAYSDAIYVMLAVPEFAPLVIIFLIGYGVYRYIKRRMRYRAKETNNKEHLEDRKE